ncbi:dienelactone hydrolase family protein [Pseudorhodoferax sp.]|uniref:carboxylesterase family protein n=1 Tax=Pseudorhodoferax sp. TaxID=1993553 RepID=UPI002DD66DFB|nr:dienelactone hydrolase family protein [Pseudorhodoferax sp.]
MTTPATVLRTAAAPLPGERAESFNASIHKRVALRYWLWMPDDAARPPWGWPLVIFLHGSGERGDDLARVKAHGLPKYAAAGRRFPFVLVAPQIPDGMAWDSDALEALRADLVARLPIDTERVLMTGLSMGGFGTWAYAMDYPDRLAGIVPVCGIGDSDRVERIRHLPVWAFHGALDDAVPIASDRGTVEALRAVGGNVRFTVYPDVGHNAWDPAYADPEMLDWMLAQRRASPG